VVERELRVSLELATDGGDSWPVVRVAGEVDIETSPALEEQLQSVLDQGHASVVVDLGEVTFMDSTGLSALIGGLRRCQAIGGELRLVSPRPNVRKVLEVTGLVDTFQVDDGNGENA
jgi:anti-sigma B factor antagonist